MSANIHISIVIVNYNVKQLLLQCLKSIYSNIGAGLVIETIVVDNNSADDSVESLKKEYPQVILIENKFNAGFSGANNQGMEIAKGECVFLLNPDTEVLGNALEQLYFYLKANEDCSIVAPRLWNSDHTIQISVWKNHAPIDLVLETFFLHNVIGRLNYPIAQLKSTFEVKTASGAALFFNKNLIKKIGMLDVSLFWMEDIDFSKRAQECGKLMYLQTAEVIHHSGQSQKKNYNISIANQLLSKLKYYKKYHSFLGYVVATLSCFIFIVSRIIIFGLLSPTKDIYLLKLRAYLYTFKRYFKYLFLNDKKLV